MLKKQGSNICFAFIVILLALVPVMFSAGLMNSSTVLFLGKCIAFAVVAMGLDLIWGYTGILSLGHGLYFALGGYAMAMYLKLQSTGGKITDFMHTGGLEELPLVWKPFLNLPLSIVMIILVELIVYDYVIERVFLVDNLLIVVKELVIEFELFYSFKFILFLFVCF